MCQGGNFTCHNGTGSRPNYGEKFEDENFILKHTVLASCLWQMLDQTPMAPNPSSALPTMSVCRANVVFGKVREGMSIVKAVEHSGSRNSKTSMKITIANSCCPPTVTRSASFSRQFDLELDLLDTHIQESTCPKGYDCGVLDLGVGEEDSGPWTRSDQVCVEVGVDVSERHGPERKRQCYASPPIKEGDRLRMYYAECQLG
ncbi:hypothetical protein A6R68_07022 [Neotoma lepida]|uniref:PPIase cyclophilin-type domain-containing protein n=1 Tax=Neotoma lepida TaxID=56216 RepID=A0A1A6GDW5_NEOLE|nr:hypothetical protein A6R68_07022 [Neotoma lepida]